jgi:opacity protein-like surface antigen
MRTVFSYTGIFSVSVLAAFSCIASNSHINSPVGTKKVIYGLSQTQHVDAASQGQFYVQAGTFKNVNNANTFKKQLTKKYNQPTTVKPKGNYYVVIMGPMDSASVRALNDSSLIKAPLVHKNTVKPIATRPILTRESQGTSQVVIGDKDGLNPTVPNHFDIIGAIGVADLEAGDGYLGVTSSETDRLVQTNSNDWNTLAAQLGVGYVYYFQNYTPFSDTVQWFTAIEPQINGYYLGQGDINGDVWRFSNSNFNDMTYHLSIESYRLMLDGALTVVSRRQYSLYAKGGIGEAWNRVGYSDADRNSVPCTNQFLNLNSASHSSFAWEVGAGIFYAINNRFALSLEYLYADLGTAKTADTGFTGTITTPFLTPARFGLTSQAALLGLHVAI